MSLERKRFEFGEFFLDEEEKVLRRHDRPVSITPKAFQLLLFLVENHGRLLTKSELLKEVWADSFVEDSNVTFTINLLRKALGDDRHNPQFIETIPKHGYRFIAEIRPAAEVVPLSAPAQSPAESPRSGYLLGVGALVILFVVVAGLWFYLSNPPKTTASDGKSILVLPLKPIDQNARDGVYEFGIADSLIQRLGSIKGLAVRPLSAGRRYADTDEDPLAIGREQHVEYVLASNYQIAGGKIRVTAQLLNVESGKIEETRKSEKDLGDVFAVQDAISEDVSKLFQTRFGTPANSPAIQRGTANEEAYRFYLQGTILVDKENMADAKRAIELFDEAVALDPNYAQAWAGKARAHCVFAHNGGNTPDAEFAKAKPAIDRAFAIDRNLAEAHAVLGIIKSDYDWDFADGEKEFRRAIDLAPNSDIFYRWYANRLAVQGRADESIAMVKTAIDLNPDYINHQIYYGRNLYYARRYDEAIKQLELAGEIDSNNIFLLSILWQCYHTKGDNQRAYESFMKFQRLIGTKDDVLKTYETLNARSGWRSVLRKNLELVKANDANGGAAYTLALLSAFTEDREQCLHYLNEALKNRSLELPGIKSDPAFDFLRDSPRFEEIVRGITTKNGGTN